jgi:hypothetical protein
LSRTSLEKTNHDPESALDPKMTQHFGQFTVDQASTLAAQFRQYLAQQRDAKKQAPGPQPGPGGPSGHDDGGPPPPNREKRS